MPRTIASLAMALIICGTAQAATINTTITVNASGSLTSSAVTGTANLTNIGPGTITATFNFANATATTIPVPFTITLTAGGTIRGTLTIPITVLSGGPLTGSATINGGTGTYAGATGSFPNLTGNGTVNDMTLAFTLSITGPGTINTDGSGGPATPEITAVLDAGSYTMKIAKGSIFVVKGANMSASGLKQFGFPLPTNSDGVRITFTPFTGGAGTDAFLIYLFNQNGVNQLAAVLPSSLAAGNYNVTVTFNETASAGFLVEVVDRKIGLITQDSSGSGLAVLQNYISATQLDVDRFTTGSIGGFTISPAKPLQIVIAWATGMGGVAGGDNIASPGFDFRSTVNVVAIVGGMRIPTLYAGRAPSLAGADQINFQLPADVPTGCTVSFQVEVNGVLSNPTFISIAPNASATACVQAGFTTSQLQAFDQGGSRTIGQFSLTQGTSTVPSLGTIKQNSSFGSITKYTGFQLASLSFFEGVVQTGCQVFRSTTGSSGIGGAVIGLDAGVVTLNGPGGSNITNAAYTQEQTFYTYSLSLGTEGLPPGTPGLGGINANLVAGNYMLRGAGGRDVGAFNTQITLGPPFVITGPLPTTINRGSGLTINWTGGNASDIVSIFGSSSTITGSSDNFVSDTTSFICITTAGPGTYTVPASILTQLPAVTAAAITAGTANGALSVSLTPPAGTFTASLTAGGSLDSGSFLASIGTSGSAAYQ